VAARAEPAGYNESATSPVTLGFGPLPPAARQRTIERIRLRLPHIPDYVTIYRIHGPFLFGSTDKLTAIDATGLRPIQDFADRLPQVGKTLLLCEAPPQPSKLMHRAEFERHVGDRHILPDVETAIRRAREVYEARDRDVAPRLTG
jgi:SulP family sulfate permease